jgi:hypothetical protein
MLRHLPQIIVAEMFDEVHHERVIAAPVAEVEELVVEVAGGLTGYAREVAFRRRTAFLPMTAGARENPLCHGVGPSRLGRWWGSGGKGRGTAAKKEGK